MLHRTMSHRTTICIAAAAILGAASASTDALAAGRAGAHVGGVYRGGAVGYHGGAYRGRYAYRGGPWRPGVGAAVGVGAAALGVAAAGSYNNYYDSADGYGAAQPNYYASENGAYQPIYDAAPQPNYYASQPSFSNYDYGGYQPSYGYGGYLSR